MAISPLKSERIAFEHPYFLVAQVFMLRTVYRKCIDRGDDCKKRNSAIGVLAAGLVLAVSACSPAPHAPAPQPMIAGGWQAADPASDTIKVAASYAASQLPEGHSALVAVRSAQTQVVAGTNIRMLLSLADGSIWEVTVWHKLDGSYALSGAQAHP